MKKKQLPKNFCPIPFTSMILDPFGNVLSCREQGKDHILGNIKEQHWSEVWNNEKYRSWRKEFLDENIVTCKTHQRDRNCHNANWNLDLLKDVELSEVVTRPPRRLSPDLNGQCNLECTMCHVWKDPNGLYDEINFWEDAEKTLFPYLTQIDPLHGEPMIQKDTFRIMDFISKNNSECEFRITTNGHYRFSKFIQDKLDKIKVYNLNISIDTINEKNYSEIRKFGDVKVVLKYLEDCLEYRKSRIERGIGSFTIQLNTTMHIQNMYDLPEFFKFAQSKENVIPLIQMLYEPSELSILSLPLKKRIKLYNFYKLSFTPEQMSMCSRVTVPLLDSLKKN
jgi:radical SAM protein with 4Fe4S-binding SPASM domain